MLVGFFLKLGVFQDYTEKTCLKKNQNNTKQNLALP